MSDTRPGLVLMGLRGSGKSTLGRLVAGRLGWPFVDLDDVTVWMEGDARENSLDSRRFGAVPTDALEGRVLAVVWSRSGTPDGRRRILRRVR